MGKLILVVEDQEDNRRILRDLLTSSGFEVVEANLASIPIIVVTSYALSGDDKKAYDAGCDEYVAKPFSPRKLLAKVRNFLS